MEINVQFVKMRSGEVMDAFVRRKLNKLEKRYDWIIKADVF